MKFLTAARVITLGVLYLLLISACGGGGSTTPPASDQVLYVSTTGNDADDGTTPTTAKATIESAIAAAVNGTQIRVASGTYDITTAIQLKSGVELSGGYSANFSVRNPSSNITIIRRSTTGPIVNVVIESNDSSIGAATIVDGFTIDGGNSGIQSFGADIISGSPTIQNNVIKGGQGNGTRGIRIRGGSPVINNNVIQDCEGGLFITLDAVSPVITNNTIIADTGLFTSGINANSFTGSTNILIEGNSIYAGDAAGTFNNAVGIWTSAATAIIRSNIIDAGSVNDSANGVTNGIRISGGTATITNNLIYGGDGGGRSAGVESYVTADVWNNTIDGGSGVISSAVYNDGFPTTALVNNIFMTTGGTNRYCVYENSAPPVAIQNNNFFRCTTAQYYDDDGGCTGGNNCTIAEIHVSMAAIAYGNISADPMFVDIDGPLNDPADFSDNDWHLTTAAAVEVFEGGQDLSAEFGDDFDGNSRTSGFNGPPFPANFGAAGWSMGAYELDQ